MKWFKHYENAHTNHLIQSIINGPKGLENGMRYWLLLELLCREFKKDTTVFILSEELLKSHLRISHGAKLKKFVQVLVENSQKFDQNLFKISQNLDNFWKIETPIILELMGKDFKRTRQRSGNATAKKKEERIKNNINAHFDFEAVYQNYPLKKGKSRGMKKIQREIKKPEDFERFSRAVENYAGEVKNTEPRFIKHFSTFVAEWEDWAEYKSITSLDRAMQFLGEGEIND